LLQALRLLGHILEAIATEALSAVLEAVLVFLSDFEIAIAPVTARSAIISSAHPDKHNTKTNRAYLNFKTLYHPANI
jgi:hypothetical protein